MELRYESKQGAAITRYVHSEEKLLAAMQSLMRRHIEVELVNPNTSRIAGNVQQAPGGRWTYWYDLKECTF